jgi:transcriptional regulator with GAF, ATPase, and Fis domain
MPAVQKALKAAPGETDGVREAEKAVHEAMIVRRTETRAERSRETTERRAEAVATRRLEREDARIAHAAEKERLLTDKRKAERAKVEIALENAHFNVVDAAHKLGMTPSGLYMKMARLGLYTRRPRHGEGAVQDARKTA